MNIKDIKYFLKIIDIIIEKINVTISFFHLVVKQFFTQLVEGKSLVNLINLVSKNNLKLYLKSAFKDLFL